jgi:hypothetical protein
MTEVHQSRRPYPWIDLLVPKSLSQPHLKTFLRLFEHPAVYANDCPFRVYKLDGKQLIHYYEHRGHGPPPDDLEGFLSDIYVDIRPSSHAVYVRLENGWHQWPGPSENGPAHPFVQKRYVWVHPNKVIWLSLDTLSKYRASLGSRRRMSASEFIANVFGHRETVNAVVESSTSKRKHIDWDEAATHPKKVKSEPDVIDLSRGSTDSVSEQRGTSGKKLSLTINKK